MSEHVLLLENIHDRAAKRFERHEFHVSRINGALTEDELIERLHNVRVLGVRSKTQITERVLAHATNLEAIGCFCIGTDQVALDAASAKGIAVFNAPFSNTRSVVELAIGEMVSLLRGLTVKSAQLHAGNWDKSAWGAHEVRGRTLGIVGYGNIGAQLSVLAEALGLQVLFFDIDDKLSLGNARRCETLQELLENSDIVSLHVDGRPTNQQFFGDEHFARMKPGSIFLNLCRGFVVDIDALAARLRSGHIAGAAVDVFPDEPAGKSTRFESPLRGIPNVILTPHIGGSTEEAQENIGEFVSGKLMDFLANGSTSLSVNMPALSPPPDDGTHHRLAHLHRNVPGVMAQINSILAERGVNVDAQLLATRGEYGYALTDISVDYSIDVIDHLRSMDATVRLRVLN